MSHLPFLIFVLFLLPFAATAQEAGDGPYTECADLLGSPPLDTLLTLNEGNDFGLLASDHHGASLLGIACSRDQLVEYFSHTGWELLGEDFLLGESGPPGNRHKQDYSIVFCKLRSLPWRIFFYRCEGIVGFNFFELHITHITAGGVK